MSESELEKLSESELVNLINNCCYILTRNNISEYEFEIHTYRDILNQPYTTVDIYRTRKKIT